MYTTSADVTKRVDVYANPVDDPDTDPFDPAVAGGDQFDLGWLCEDPNVVAGLVDRTHIRSVRIVDIIGDGSSGDSVGRPIFDPTGNGIGGADIDAVTVINGTHAPEPTGMLPLIGLAVLARRSPRR